MGEERNIFHPDSGAVCLFKKHETITQMDFSPRQLQNIYISLYIFTGRVISIETDETYILKHKAHILRDRARLLQEYGWTDWNQGSTSITLIKLVLLICP